MAPIYEKYLKQSKQARESRESGRPYRREFKEERSKLANKHWGTRSAKYLAAAADCDTEIDTEIHMDDACVYHYGATHSLPTIDIEDLPVWSGLKQLASRTID